MANGLTPIRIVILGENKSDKAFGDAEKASARFGVAIEGVGTLAVKSLGLIGGAAGAAALAVAGIGEAIEREALNDKLAAQLGATPEMAADYGKIAGELYSDAYGESIGQVNEALKSVLQSGILPEDATNDQIESMTAKVMDFSTAMDQDLGATSRAVGQMLRTGLAKDGNEAMDILTRGFQQGANKADDLLDTVNEYGTQFRQLGLSGSQSMGLLSQGLSAGARDADIVADALKEFAIRAQDGSKTTAEGFKQIGLNGSQMAAAIAKGGPEAAAALDQTLDRLRSIKDPAQQAQAAVALFGTQSEDLQDALYSLDPSEAVAALGDVAGATDKLGDTLNDNAKTKLEAFKRTAETEVVDFLGGELLPAFEAAGDGAGPALGAIGDAFESLGDRSTFAGGIIGEGIDFAKSKFDEVEKFIGEIMPMVNQIITFTLSTIQLGWHLFGDDILSYTSRVWNMISGVWSGELQIIEGVIKLFLGVMTGDWSAALDGLQQIFGGFWDVIYAIGSGAVGILRSILGAGMSAVAFVFKSIWADAKDNFFAQMHWVEDRANDVVGFFTGMPGRMSAATSGMWNGIQNAFKDAMNWVIRKWNDFELPALQVAGAQFSPAIGTPNIPQFATGGIASGLAVVGEAGPELIHVGQPSRVYNHRDSVDLLTPQRAIEINQHFHFNIEAGASITDEDIERIVREKVLPQANAELLRALEVYQ